MLSELLKSDALTVEFQPIFHLASGRIFAHEVLGRARPLPDYDPPLGPAALVERAVEEGCLLELEHRWRRIAIASVARSTATGLFFLNVDTRILDDPRFTPGNTRRLIEQHGLQRSRFVFEITERDPQLKDRRLAGLLAHYSRQGFGIALDDLGSGSATLQMLVELRPNVIKLDRELCAGIATDPLRRALVESLVGFARASNISLVAEGIERRVDLVALAEIGVAYGQGFLLGRPRRQPLGAGVQRIPAKPNSPPEPDHPPPWSRHAG